MKTIPYGRQNIDEDDIRAAARLLRSSYITQGPNVAKFEKTLAKCCGAKYVVAVSSGTAALHIACLAAGLKKGDEAITTPETFAATANAVIYAGAKPVFADIDPRTNNIDLAKLEARINSRTKAVLPVHFAGLPCDMAGISRIAKAKKLIVIEDACHALGAEYRAGGRWFRVGSCRHSDMAVFSFHPVKHITTGEGGAVTTNNKKLYEKLLALRSHGIYKNREMDKKKGPWYYEMRDLGFNYRITDFQCAIGISQLRKLNGFLKKRRKIAGVYDKRFGNIKGVEVPAADDNARGAYHLYVLKIDFRKFKITRQKFMIKLRKHGIFTQVHYIPVYRHPYYKKRFSLKTGDFPESEKFYRKAISIPMYPGMTDRDVNFVSSTIKKVLNKR